MLSRLVSPRQMATRLAQDGFAVLPDRMRADRFAALVPSPDIVVDVGVGVGTDWLYDAFPDKPFVLIDPRPECEGEVAELYPSLQTTFVAAALGDAEGEITLNIPLRGDRVQGTKASVLNRSGAILAKITDWQTRTVPLTTLDSVLADHPGRIGLKIDTEGAEAAILRGACEVLHRCDFVVLELSLSKRFEEVEPPSAVIATLAQFGLELRDILSINGGAVTASPLQVDALFTRWEIT